MTGLSIPKYLFFTVLILQIKSSQGSSCLSSLPTLAYVQRCPRTQDEWNAASSRKQCNMLSEKHSCASFVYHCLLNQWRNATVEVCAPMWYLSGFCAIYNIQEARVIDDFNLDCTNFTLKDSCPTRYLSTQAFKYPACYEKKEIISSINNTQTRSQNQSNPIGDEEGSCQGNVPFIVLFVVALSVAVFLSILLILSRKGILWKNGKRTGKEIDDSENEKLLKKDEEKGMSTGKESDDPDSEELLKKDEEKEKRSGTESDDPERANLLKHNERKDDSKLCKKEDCTLPMKEQKKEQTEEIDERKKNLEELKRLKMVTTSPLMNYGLKEKDIGNRKTEELPQTMAIETEHQQTPRDKPEDFERIDLTDIDKEHNQDTVLTYVPNPSAEEDIEDTESVDISDKNITSDKNTSRHEDSCEEKDCSSQNLNNSSDDATPSSNETDFETKWKNTLETENEDETFHTCNNIKDPKTQTLTDSGDVEVNNRLHANSSDVLTEARITDDSRKDEIHERKGVDVRAMTGIFESDRTKET